MSFTKSNNLIYKLSNGLNKFRFHEKRYASQKHLLVTCKNKKLNHYLETNYNNLDTIPLASKGWNHSKSRGDFFSINPIAEDHKLESKSFKELNIHPELKSLLKKENVKEATGFQAVAIPEVFKRDHHVLIAAETGCGKTLCYLLPIIQSLAQYDPGEVLNSPKALILLPNRELAYQVGEIANILAKPLGINVKIVVGGRTKKMMLNPEFEHVDILIGTPGAIGKLSTVGIYKLNEVQHTVLDEADTLTDDSFNERIEGLLKRVSQSQIILVSATLPKTTPDILKPIESNLYQVISPNLHKPLLHVRQKFLRLLRTEKPGHLLDIAKNNKAPLLIFTNRNETCNWLALFLRENGVPCSNINGDMNYSIRIQQWNDFIKGNTNILSATDVGSRGLDTTQVEHVLNYEFPIYAADYLHRVGRVGRLGSPDNCKITNFVSAGPEVNLVQQIELAIRRNQPLTNVDGNITNIIQRKIEHSNRNAL